MQLRAGGPWREAVLDETGHVVVDFARLLGLRAELVRLLHEDVAVALLVLAAVTKKGGAHELAYLYQKR